MEEDRYHVMEAGGIFDFFDLRPSTFDLRLHGEPLAVETARVEPDVAAGEIDLEGLWILCVVADGKLPDAAGAVEADFGADEERGASMGSLEISEGHITRRKNK